MPQHRPPVPILTYCTIVALVSVGALGYCELIFAPALGLKPSHATLEDVRLPTMPAYAEASTTASMAPAIAAQHAAPRVEAADEMTTVDTGSTEQIREEEMLGYLETSNAINWFGDEILNCAMERYVHDPNENQNTALEGCLD